MIYSNLLVRRQDRLLDETSAVALLANGEFGILSMICGGNEAYGIPINYVWNKQNTLYLHCAPEGKKLKCIDQNNTVSFCIVGRTNVISNKFTTEYESVILQGKASRNLNEDERRSALFLFLDKYSPEDKNVGTKYVENSFHRTEIIKLEIESWSGKCKSIPPMPQ